LFVTGLTSKPLPMSVLNTNFVATLHSLLFVDSI
jgi:hypothetical protein